MSFAQAEPGSELRPQVILQERLPLPGDKASTTSDRRKLLNELYARLGASENLDNAELIVSAIENLWLRSGSDTVDLLMTRAGVLVLGEKSETALQLLNSIIEIAPGYSEGWARRAALYFNMKDFGKALEDLRHTLALEPSHFKAIQGLGFLMRELGEKKAALLAIRKALEVHPHLEDARQAEEELSREVEGQGI